MKTKAEVVFEEELSYIESEELRRFVLDVFEKFTPEYFWTVPCSTTGKYHPKISLGNGGLVRHIKLAVWWGLEIMQCWPNLAETAIGEVTAALLIHDLLKNGDKLDARGYPTLKNSSAVHGPYLGNKIRCWIGGTIADALKKDKDGPMFQEPDRIDRVIAAVEGHMSIWTDASYELLKPQYLVRENDPQMYDVCHIVHLADYVSSRKVDDFVDGLHYDPNEYSGMFACGDEDSETGIGFWAGPIPSIDLMLEERGHSDKSVIVEFDKIEGDKVVYRWNVQDGKWVAENIESDHHFDD